MGMVFVLKLLGVANEAVERECVGDTFNEQLGTNISEIRSNVCVMKNEHIIKNLRS